MDFITSRWGGPVEKVVEPKAIALLDHFKIPVQNDKLKSKISTTVHFTSNGYQLRTDFLVTHMITLDQASIRQYCKSCTCNAKVKVAAVFDKRLRF